MKTFLRFLFLSLVASASVACGSRVLGGEPGSGAGSTTAACPPEQSFTFCANGVIESECCPSPDLCPTGVPLFCDVGNGACVHGACPVFPADGGGCPQGAIAAASHDQSCTSDSDCVAVYEGSYCNVCRCPNATVSQAAAAAYEAALADAGVSTSTCFGCPPLDGTAACVGGKCAVVGGL
jgi:hypothetical protein